MEQRYFHGLNSLRFYAAFFVVLSHVHSVQMKNGLPFLPNFAFLHRGHDAVAFFFTLSGFLITYILIEELERTGNIELKKFYLKRVLRIWPLYFLIILVGLALYWVILPAMGIHYPADYDFWTGGLLYGLFLSNIMSALYQVGGILNVTWSIGVEEQFYTFWAPFMRVFKTKLLLFITFFTSFLFVVQILNQWNPFHYAENFRSIIKTLQFHNMGVGALVAYLLFYQEHKFLKLPIFTNRVIQVVLFAFLFFHYFYGMKYWPLVSDYILPFLYAWLIVNISVNLNNVFEIKNSLFEWLGSISYGMYMYHMVVIYCLLFLFKKAEFLLIAPLLTTALFYILTIFFTVLLAHLSYQYFEKRILAYKERFQ